MDRKKARKIIIPVLLAGVIAGAVFYFHNEEKQPLNCLTLYGNIDIRQIQLAFHDTGRITRLHVQEGARVRPGDLVGEMDPVRYEAEVKRLEAELDTQKWIVAKLHAGSRPQEIEQAKARVAADNALLKDAQITYERVRKLAGTQYVPRQKLDDATAALKAAKEKLKADQEALDLAVIGPRKEDIAAAEARLKSISAALDLARQKLYDTRLYAPAAGIIQDRIMEPGDMAFPQTPVFTLALDNPMWVRAYVPEPRLGKVKEGMIAEVTTDSYPGKAYRGWVGFISPTAEFTPKNVETPELRTRLVYQVRIYLCDSRGELRLGMPATVTLRLDQTVKETDYSHDAMCHGENATL